MRRLSLIAGPLLMLLMCVTVAAGQSHATFSETKNEITFSRLTSIGADVFVADPDGSNLHQVPLLYPAETFGIPVWSPDRRKLLISHTIRLNSAGQCCLFQPATVKPDGSDFNQLMPPNLPGASGEGIDCPVWSLDQSRLLCAFSGDHPGVFSIRASDGGNPLRMTTNPYRNEDLPTDISPDGTQFVFVRFKLEPIQQVALFVANIDGSGLRQLTPFGFAEAHEIAAAQWSPNGREIISENTEGRLFVIRTDGTAAPKVIRLRTGTSQYFAFEPDWSPDGTRIIFCMFIHDHEDIYTANADGSDVAQVTHTPDFENGPDWGRHPRH